ncbi:MAG TPA: CYCXC family (seleno)protein [Pyrinomonadaceae bacterium]
MKTKYLILIIVIVGAAVAALIVKQRSRVNEREPHSSVAEKQVTPQPDTATVRVPTHYEQPPSLSSLGPTLSPDKFIGMTRAAYQAAQEIPQTIAQMPCYCHCDRSLGHKSLHSCFEDDHAAHCAVCAGEALMAYKLQKEQKLSVAQIRERIIAEYQTQ